MIDSSKIIKDFALGPIQVFPGNPEWTPPGKYPSLKPMPFMNKISYLSLSALSAELTKLDTMN